MKILVTYASLCGNTRQIAEAIHATIPNSVLMMSKDVSPEIVAQYDCLCIGYWIDKGDCDVVTKALLASLQHQQVILFGTLGASEQNEYYAYVKKTIEQQVKESKIMGHFLCQGRVSEALIERYHVLLQKNPDDIHMKEQVANYEAGKTHPDAQDIAHAKAFVKALLVE